MRDPIPIDRTNGTENIKLSLLDGKSRGTFVDLFPPLHDVHDAHAMNSEQ